MNDLPGIIKANIKHEQARKLAQATNKSGTGKYDQFDAVADAPVKRQLPKQDKSGRLLR